MSSMSFPKIPLMILSLFLVMVIITVSTYHNAYGLCLKTCQLETQRLAAQKANETKTQDTNGTKIGGKIIKIASLVTEGKIRGNYGNFITIELSRTCLAQVKANLTTKCPTYQELEKFDTTNKKISGKFEFDDFGFYHRGKPLYKNYQLSYTPAKFPLVVCVDCSDQIFRNSKTIFVEAFDYVFKNNKDNVIKNFTRYEYSSRSVKDCHEAMIAYSPFLLNDTINFLNSGCTKTEFNDTKSIYMTPKPIGDRMQYKEYQYQKWLKDAKATAQELAKQKCKNKCDVKVR